MKQLLCFLILLLLQLITFAQIKNPGFENKSDSIPTLPKEWNYKKSEGYIMALDSIIKHSGEQSLQIKNVNSQSGDFPTIKQVVSITADKLTRINITAFIKTENVKGIASLWCQLWDTDDNMIGFATTQGMIQIDSTTNWKKYTLPLIIKKNVKKLFFGGLLLGTGTIWFDDFTIDHFSNNNSKPAPKEVTKFLNQVMDTIRLNSLYRDSINWVSLTNDIKYLSKGINTIQESYTIVNYIVSNLQAVGDNHSYHMPKKAADDLELEINPSGRQPEGEYLGKNIGYIKVPAFGSLNDSAEIHFAEKIQKIIKDIDTQNEITGWIIDLRENGGGNMYPMIAGLGPILGIDTLGYFAGAKTKTPWYNSARGSGEGNKINTQIKDPYFIKNSQSKMAVLIGANTASSGEATAISFIGKPNTKLFGQPSAGFTTANELYKLSDGSILVLASTFEVDRNMKMYAKRIEPNVICNIDTKGDSCIEAAKNWILMK